MTPTPWAQAVNPLQAAVEAMRCTPGCKDTGGVSHFPELCRQCLDLKARAALPHLLRAVVEELAEGQRADTVALPMQYLDGHTVAEVYRTALLAALTNAAERATKVARVDAVTPDPHIGDHA